MEFNQILSSENKREIDLEWERRRDELISSDARIITSGELIIYLIVCSCLEKFGVEMFMDVKACKFADFLSNYAISTLPIDLYTRSLDLFSIDDLSYIIKSRVDYLAKSQCLIEEEVREFAMLQSCLLRIMPEEED